MAEQMEVKCKALNCEQHDEAGCLKVYIELDIFGRCAYFRLADDGDQEEQEETIQ